MSAGGLSPTRMVLLRTARRLGAVRRGAALLRRKREALVGELFRVARPAADARARIEAATRSAYPALLAALAAHGATGLEALAWPPRDVALDIEAGSVWGIPIARIGRRPPLARSLAARGMPPGPAGPAALRAAAEFERLAELLLDAAPREMLLRRLGEALAHTSRQVNMLERRVTPTLERQLAAVRRALDEREREERLRLKHLLHRRQSFTVL